jgi:beta-lactamase superfamily II metal-dependent hydrolase
VRKEDANRLGSSSAAAGHNGGIVPLLHGEGVSRIDHLILGHAHADHTGGVSSV